MLPEACTHGNTHAYVKTHANTHAHAKHTCTREHKHCTVRATYLLRPGGRAACPQVTPASGRPRWAQGPGRRLLSVPAPAHHARRCFPAAQGNSRPSRAPSAGLSTGPAPRRFLQGPCGWSPARASSRGPGGEAGQVRCSPCATSFSSVVAAWRLPQPRSPFWRSDLPAGVPQLVGLGLPSSPMVPPPGVMTFHQLFLLPLHQ